MFLDDLPRWNPDTKLLMGGSSSGSALGGEELPQDVSMTAFREIDSLLHRAYEFSLQLPTTKDRLAHNSLFLPPGHCFDEESCKDIVELEALSIGSFQTNILHIQKSISVFKATQDARCKPYEEEAKTYMVDINNADRAAADVSAADASENVSFFIIISFLCA